MTSSLLLCTDLDRTLIPNGPAPESPGARALFARLSARPEVSLAYVSGRDAGRIQAAMEDFGLPEPDHVIADVGTSIYDIRGDHTWIRNRHWEDDIGQDWGKTGHARLADMLAKLPFLELQEASRQNRFKLSFYFPADRPESQVAQTVRAQLSAVGIPATLILSIDEPREVGLLDVLPERANKLHAITFLMKEFGFDPEQTVFCGDSGNDLSVLASAVPGVLVANATDAVRARAWALAEEAGTAAFLYTARGSFMKMNGNYAAGILEGVCHYHPGVADWLVDRGEKTQVDE